MRFPLMVLVLLSALPAFADEAKPELIVQTSEYGGWWSVESAIAITPDGQLGAVADGRGSVTLWDLSLRQRIRSFSVADGHQTIIDSIRLVNGGGALMVSATGAFTIWNTATGERTFHQPRIDLYGHEGLHDFSVARAAPMLAHSDSNQSVVVELGAAGEGIREQRVIPNAGMARLELSDDGRLLAVFSYQSLRVLDAKTLELRMEVATDDVTNPVTFERGMMRFSPDNRHLVIGSERIRNTARVFEIATGTMRRLEGARAPQFFADGRLIHLAEDGCLMVTAWGSEPQRLPAPCRNSGGIGSFAVSENGIVFGGRRIIHGPSGTVIGDLSIAEREERLVDFNAENGLLRVSATHNIAGANYMMWPDRSDPRRRVWPGLYEWDLGTGQRRRLPEAAWLSWVTASGATRCAPMDHGSAVSWTDEDGMTIVVHTGGISACEGGQVTRTLARTGAQASFLRLVTAPDGTRVLFVQVQSVDNEIEVWDWDNGIQVGASPLRSIALEVVLGADGDLWFATRNGLARAGREGLVYTGLVDTAVFDTERQRFVIGVEEGLRLVPAAGGEAGEVIPLGGARTTDLMVTGDHLFAMTEDGAIWMVDLTQREAVAGLYAVGETGSIILTPSGDYMASRDAVDVLTLRQGLRLRSFGAFDVERNRPDRVLPALGYANPQYLQTLSHLVTQRERRLGTRVGSVDLALPLHWAEWPPLYTTSRTLELGFRAPERSILHVFVDNVPVNTAGVAVRGDRTAVPLTLGPGTNRITAYVQLPDGRFSDTRIAHVHADLPQPVSRTWFVGVGVSSYRQSSYDLQFAAKDIQDAEAWFRTRSGAGFESLVLTDRSATREAILAARRFLARATVDDRVILYVAGHGLLGDDGLYYFAPTDMDFAQPARRGVTFADLEGLVNSSSARERLVFIDSCHAGENDEGLAGLVPVGEATETVGYAGTVMSRGLRRPSEIPDDAPLIDRPLVEDLFVDLREGSGAHVIAASGAAEFALESERWNNGVFTASVLHGLESKEADLDGDRRIRIDELRRYVADRVATLTQGRQVPTSRAANHARDFTVIAAEDPIIERWPGRVDGEARAAAWSGDSRFVVTVRPGVVQRWSERTPTEVSLPIRQVRNVVVDHDGRRALVLADEYELHLVDFESGQVARIGGREEGGHLAQDPLVAAFSRDGEWLLVEAGFPGRGALLIPVQAPVRRLTIQLGLRGFIRGVASPGGAKFRIVSGEGEVVELDMAESQVAKTLVRWSLPGLTAEEASSTQTAVVPRLSADGRWFARPEVGDSMRLSVWDLEQREPVATWPLAGLIGAHWVGNEGRLAVFDGMTYRVINAANGGEYAWLYRGDLRDHFIWLPWLVRPDGGELVSFGAGQRVMRWPLAR